MLFYNCNNFFIRALLISNNLQIRITQIHSLKNNVINIMANERLGMGGGVSLGAATHEVANR